MRVIAVIFLFFILQVSYASTPSKLSKLIEQISNVKQILFKHQSEKSNLEKELEKTETAIDNTSMRLQKTLLALEDKQKILKNLANRQIKIKQKIKKQQLLLLQQIRNSYLLGLNKNKLQFLLLSKDPEKINRLLTYNHYLMSTNASLIASLKQDINSLCRNHAEIAKRASALSSLKQNQLSEQKVLDVNKSNQQVLLKKINAQVKSQTEKLQELIKNKKNLEKILAQLQKKTSSNANFLTHAPSQSPWPTQGKIIEQFGSAIQQSELKQNGVLIAAPEGQKVFSVAPGKVIFANWMPGYGLLLIIDHGKGYMTLYGNNGLLYKKKNDLVSARELISAVGHTGGQQKSVLYFALRSNGKAIDPKTWCH